MKWTRPTHAVAGAFVAGILLAGGVAHSQGALERLTAISELLLPRMQEGREITNGDTAFATYDTDLQDLPVLVPESGEAGRYQAIALGDSKEFVILDTRLGLARRFSEDGSTVVVYSARVPNHAITQAVRRHDAFESTTRREIRTKQP